MRRRRNVVHLRRLRCLQSARLGGSAPPPSRLQSCSDRCKMSCFFWHSALERMQEEVVLGGGISDWLWVEEQNGCLLSLLTPLLKAGAGSRPLTPSQQSYLNDIFCIKKKKDDCFTLQILILQAHEKPLTLTSIIMELCWSHVFPAWRTIMKAKNQPSVKH